MEEEGDGQGMDRLQMREAWPYWDSVPLMRHREGDVVVLRDVESCGREVGTSSLFPGQIWEVCVKIKTTRHDCMEFEYRLIYHLSSIVL